MSGFVGDIQINEKQIIEEMLNTINHRGPIGRKIYVGDKSSFGQLSLTNKKFELYNKNKTKIIVFDGEIYNKEELKKDLSIKEEVTSSQIVMLGYEKYKEKILNKLKGMFAFVIYDLKTKELFGARDQMGIKPFYYYLEKNKFIVASEIKAFLKSPNFKKELNEKMLENYLIFQFPDIEKTFFKNVYKLKPGHYFKYNNKLIIKQYFEFNFNLNYKKTTKEWKKDLKETLENSVKMHLKSDFEIGSFLSSGVDSSYLVAQSGVLKTFTAEFNNDKYREIDYVKKLTKKLKIKNYSKTITKEEYFRNLPKIMYHFDEPLADPSAPSLYFLSKLAKDKVPIVLSGEGADELFGGYNIYKEQFTMAKYDMIPYFIRYSLGKIASLFPPQFGINFLIRRGQKIEKRFVGQGMIFYEKELKKILKIKKKGIKYTEILKPYYKKVEKLDDALKMQFIDLNFWLVSDILNKADKMSMANSLQVRLPFLDLDVVKLAQTIPTKEKVNIKETKKIFRLVANDILDNNIAYKRKLGFPVPVVDWLRDEVIYLMIRTRFLEDDRFFNTKYILKLLDNHYNKKGDNMRKIWVLYSFLIWYDVYFS